LTHSSGVRLRSSVWWCPHCWQRRKRENETEERTERLIPRGERKHEPGEGPAPLVYNNPLLSALRDQYQSPQEGSHDLLTFY
jgi:hypothetical protein